MQQNRKRRREDDLQHDCQCPLRTADELRGSYLLFGLPERLRVASQPSVAKVASSTDGTSTSCAAVNGILELLQIYAAICRRCANGDDVLLAVMVVSMQCLICFCGGQGRARVLPQC